MLLRSFSEPSSSSQFALVPKVKQGRSHKVAKRTFRETVRRIKHNIQYFTDSTQKEKTPPRILFVAICKAFDITRYNFVPRRRKTVCTSSPKQTKLTHARRLASE